MGNWASLTNDGGSAQTRTHDVQNRITTVSGATSPLHSANGEMTRDETGQLLAYDAWGRLVTVNTDGTGGVEITNLYDALHRWIKRNTNEFYYTASWQQIEERDAQGVEAQFVWSPVYIDAMVLRDRDSDNDGVMEATDERLYVVHDANFNVTSLVDATGAVLERLIYDPYGTRSVLDANWSADGDNTSDYGFDWGHQGGRHNLLAGLISFGFRWLDTSLGRWITQDPSGFRDGANLYSYTNSAPSSGLDPDGLTTRRQADDEWEPAVPGGCRVIMRCKRVPRTLADHCGLIMEESGGIVNAIDGTGTRSSGKPADSNSPHIGIAARPGRPAGRTEGDWLELPPDICACLRGRRFIDDLNRVAKAAGIGYRPLGPNSAFALKCHMLRCGVKFHWKKRPTGWGDHDGKDCDERGVGKDDLLPPDSPAGNPTGCATSPDGSANTGPQSACASEAP